MRCFQNRVRGFEEPNKTPADTEESVVEPLPETGESSVIWLWGAGVLSAVVFTGLNKRKTQ